MNAAARRRGTGLVTVGAAGIALVAAAPGPAAGGPPHVSKLLCVSVCAGAHRVAPGAVVRWSGRHLARVRVVRFPSRGGERISVKPESARGNLVTARVPASAVSGRPSLVVGAGVRAFAKRPLRIVSESGALNPAAFRLLHSRARPKLAFFAGRRVHLSYRFRARGPRNVRLELVRASTGTVVDRIFRRQAAPFARHTALWSAAKASGSPAPAGGYELRVARTGERGHDGAELRIYPFDFPVRGSHGYGGAEQRFGAPRSGGRVHQGQDVFAPCGTREVAARGGRVQAEGYDPALYGHWLVIDGRGTRTDYRYAHLAAPTPLGQGERVRTGQTVGRVGRTGNARTVGCMLHFEEWPRGWENGSPVDPLPDLERWDGWN